MRGFTDEWAVVGRGEFRWPRGHTDTMVAKLLLGEQKQRPPGSWPLLWEGLRHGRPFQRWRRGKIKERSGASEGMFWISSSFDFTKVVCVFFYLTCPFLWEESWNSFTELICCFSINVDNLKHHLGTSLKSFCTCTDAEHKSLIIICAESREFEKEGEGLPRRAIRVYLTPWDVVRSTTSLCPCAHPQIHFHMQGELAQPLTLCGGLGSWMNASTPTVCPQK